MDLSKNIALEAFYCNHNEITSLDISANTKLKTIDCQYLALTNLDVTANINLTQLSCYNNQLTSLDVSNNTALEGLSCSENQLTAIDVSIHPALENLYCDNNQLTKIDVSKNPALRSLGFNNNQLTSLNIQNGNNENLVYVHFQDNPNLSCVQVDDAAFSTANWTDEWWAKKDETAMFSTSCMGTVSLNDLESFYPVTIFPNPAQQAVQITMELAIYRLQVYAMTGQKLIDMRQATNRLDISALPNGVYQLQIFTDEGLVSKKLVKE